MPTAAILHFAFKINAGSLLLFNIVAVVLLTQKLFGSITHCLQRKSLFSLLQH